MGIETDCVMDVVFSNVVDQVKVTVIRAAGVLWAVHERGPESSGKIALATMAQYAVKELRKLGVIPLVECEPVRFVCNLGESGGWAQFEFPSRGRRAGVMQWLSLSPYVRGLLQSILDRGEDERWTIV